MACIEKPRDREHKDFAAASAHLLQTVKLMSEVKVVRRWPRMRRDAAVPEAAPISALRHSTQPRIEFVGIGASTGGPPVLQTILSALPKGFGVPILVVQHIATGFIGGLVEWLNQTTACKVHIAAYGTCNFPDTFILPPMIFTWRFDMTGRSSA